MYDMEMCSLKNTYLYLKTALAQHIPLFKNCFGTTCFVRQFYHCCSDNKYDMRRELCGIAAHNTWVSYIIKCYKTILYIVLVLCVATCNLNFYQFELWSRIFSIGCLTRHNLYSRWLGYPGTIRHMLTSNKLCAAKFVPFEQLYWLTL